jgi:hypothetical protein
MGKWLIKPGLLMTAALAFPQLAYAANSVLAGRFEGSEPTMSVVWPSYVGLPPLATQEVRFTVSVSGMYRLEDAFEHWYFNLEGHRGLAMINALYLGNFNPQNPALNRQGPNQYDAWPRQLDAGVEYTLVLQNPSGTNAEGVWTLVINGPGEVNSTARTSVAGLGQGKFTGTESASTALCTETAAIYQVQGPFKVSRDGIYYFTNLSHLSTAAGTFWDNQLCFGLYSAPPDPVNPEVNRLGYMNFYRGSFELQTNTDYYLLVQSVQNLPLDYFLLVAPPAPFEITSHMSGVWADPETDGQGVMLNVYPSIDAVHLAWFTYDLQPPSGQATAQIGDPGHRWLTAFGGLEGSDSNMAITRTQGGVFDAAQPVPEQIQDGNVQLHFDSCTSGTLIYDLGSAHAVGQLNLRRPFEDRANIDRCELANMGPDIPGPL